MHAWQPRPLHLFAAIQAVRSADAAKNGLVGASSESAGWRNLRVAFLRKIQRSNEPLIYCCKAADVRSSAIGSRQPCLIGCHCSALRCRCWRAYHLSTRHFDCDIVSLFLILEKAHDETVHGVRALWLGRASKLGSVYAKSYIISMTTAKFRKPGNIASSLSNRVQMQSPCQSPRTP